MCLLTEYKRKANESILKVCWVYDLARSAEKMMDWSCVGEDNLAWQEGPFLSAPANKQSIDRSFPYYIKTSRELSVACSLVIEDPTPNERGGVKIPMPPIDPKKSNAENLLSKLSIIEQFELFKEFLMEFDGPFNKKRREEWSDRLTEELNNLLTEITNRRNELTHDSCPTEPTIREAVLFFYNTRQLAEELYKIKDM